MSTQGFIFKKSFLAAGIIAVSTLLGLVRESSIAYMFGASGYTDAYFIAIIIPGIFTGTVGAALKNTFVTVYSGYLAHNEQEKAWHTANSLISLLLVLLTLVLGVLIIFAPALISLVAPGYAGEKFSLAVSLARMVMPTLVFGSLLGIFVGMNNSHNSFTAPSSVGLAANIVQVLCIYLLGKLWGIYGLAVGFALGVLAQFLIQLPFVRRHGFRFRFRLDLSDPGMKQIAVLIAPFVFSAAVGQVNQIVYRILATGLPEGVVSSLYFAGKLVDLPYVIFCGAIGMIAYPSMVKAAAKGDWDGLKEVTIRAVRLLIIVLAPAMVGIYVLRTPLIKLLFEHGSFVSGDTQITAGVIPYLLGTLLFGGLVSLLSGVYYANKHMKFVVSVSALSVLLNVGLSIVLVRSMAQKGLALASTLSAGVNAVCLIAGFFLLLRWQDKGEINTVGFYKFAASVGCSCLGMGWLVNAVYNAANPFLPGFGGNAFGVLLSVMAGVISYVLINFVLGMDEARNLGRWIGKRIKVPQSGLGRGSA